MNNNRQKQLAVGIAAYLIGALIFIAITYFNTHQHLISDIDTRLQLAAYATKSLLGDDLHSAALNPNSMSATEDYATSLQLTEFARNIGIDYVYSMIERDGEIYFVTSTATDEELANDSYQPAFFMEYPEASPVVYEVFATGTSQYSEYSDRWGEFRSIFVPFTAPDGSTYVIGADLSLREVSAIAWRSALFALFACIGLGLIGLPVVILYAKSIQREAKNEIEQSYRCSLTGLPNRNCLLNDLAKADYANVSVINIDKFREIATLYGPAVGDDVLKQFSLRLSRIDSSALDNYKSYRLHGDEFATLVTGKQNRELLREQLTKLYNHLIKHPYQAGEQRVKLRIRMGAASSDDDAFVMADMALREARKTNRSIVVYENKLHLPEAYRESFEKTQRFRQALEEKRFTPYFQPIASTTTGEFEKFECLARMIDSSGAVIDFPNDFLPIAYRSRLYHQFTQLMLEKIFAIVEQHEHTVSINLSVSDIYHEPTVQYIYQRLANHQLASLVEFELMENENISSLGKIIRFIQKVKAFGSRVGLDDLGKDYSNIDRLIALPVDFVKIDGNIVSHLATDKEAQDIARMIVSFSYRRNIKTVAEFCSDGRTSDMARRLGVDYLQGYHIGTPQSKITRLSQAALATRDPLNSAHNVL